MKRMHTLLYSITVLGFTLGISNGYLALWTDGQQSPLHVYPILAESFPETDQSLLIHGIRAETEEALASLLEDYLS